MNKIENRNHENAWNHFEKLGYARYAKMTLHHKDITMKQRDPKRYAEWRPEDLEPMTLQEHRRLHMRLQNPKGTTFTKAHRTSISESARSRIDRKSKVVRIAKSDDIQYFTTYAAAARYIGCSRALVSQCLNEKQANRTACGYKIEIFKQI